MRTLQPRMLTAFLIPVNEWTREKKVKGGRKIGEQRGHGEQLEHSIIVSSGIQNAFISTRA